MNGKFFPGGSRFPSAKIDLKLAVGGSRSHNNGQEQYWKLITLAQKDDTFRHQWTKNYVSGQVQVPNIGQNQLPRIANSSYCYYYCVTKNLDGHISGTKWTTRDPQVSKRPKFWGLFRFSNKNRIFGFLDFCISVFLYFCIFWISGHISGTKRATGDFLMSKRPDFQGLSDFQ